MNHDQIWNAVNERYKADKAAHAGFPDHVCGQAAMVARHVGKLTHVAVVKKYGKELNQDELNAKLEEHALDTIVQAIRFLENIK